MGVIVQRLTVSEEIIVSGDRSSVFDLDKIRVRVVYNDIRPPVDILTNLDSALTLQPLPYSSPRSPLCPVVEPVVLKSNDAEPERRMVSVFFG